MKSELFLTEEQIRKCYKCTESYCPVWSPFGEPIGTSISLETFLHDFTKRWIKRMNTEVIPCLERGEE